MRTALACLLAVLVGFSALARDDKKPEKKSNASPGFESLKKLVGDWEATGPDGKPAATRFKLTAGGSVLIETLFPGTEHEMVTVYHMDGKDLVMTHYCMLGNQPHLKADDPANGKKLSFKSIGGTNMKLDDMHMGRAVFTFVDNDHYEVEWCSCQGGKPDENHCFVMKATRKKGA